MFDEGGNGKRIVVVAVAQEMLYNELVGVASVDVLQDGLDSVVVHPVVSLTELLFGLRCAVSGKVRPDTYGKPSCFASQPMDNLVKPVLLPFAPQGFISFTCCVLLEAFGRVIRGRGLFSCLDVVWNLADLDVGFAVPSHGFDVPRIVRGGVANASFDATGDGSPKFVGVPVVKALLHPGFVGLDVMVHCVFYLAVNVGFGVVVFFVVRLVALVFVYVLLDALVEGSFQGRRLQVAVGDNVGALWFE